MLNQLIMEENCKHLSNDLKKISPQGHKLQQIADVLNIPRGTSTRAMYLKVLW